MNVKHNQPVQLTVAGAIHLDDVAYPIAPLVPKASNPVRWVQSVGGVAANAGCAAQRAGFSTISTELVAAVGDDAPARSLASAVSALSGLTTRFMPLIGQPTGRYSAVMNQDGELYIGLADVSLAEQLSAEHILPKNAPTQALLLDANLSLTCIESVCARAMARNITVAALSVSPAKAVRLLSVAPDIALLFCNRREAMALTGNVINASLQLPLHDLADQLLDAGFKQLVLSDGSAPVLIHDSQGRHFIDVPFISHTHSVNGAGDAMAGATMAAWLAGHSLSDAVAQYGLVQAAAVVRGEQRALSL